jgi:hypothetical protein
MKPVGEHEEEGNESSSDRRNKGSKGRERRHSSNTFPSFFSTKQIKRYPHPRKREQKRNKALPVNTL